MTPVHQIEGYSAPLRLWYALPYAFPSEDAARAFLARLRATNPGRELRLAPTTPHRAA